MNRRDVCAAALLPAAALLLLLSPAPAGARQMPRASDGNPPPRPAAAEEPAGHPHAAVTVPPPIRPRAALTKEDRRLLAVPRADRELYADFLRQSGTGIVRLLPRGAFDKQVSLSGGGAYYSFDSRTHEYGYGSDIELQQGRLSVGFAGADFGFMADLGEVPLEGVTAETDGVQFMASYETPSAEAEARAAYREFGRRGGRAEGAWTYGSGLPAVAGRTYALRSVNYGASDVLVAFTVLREDDDGSVVLLWKMLKRFPTPTLRGRP